MPPPRLEAADLNDVIRQTAPLYEGRLNGVELQLEFDRQMPLAMLDVEQMKRVFVHLIDNAVEAMGGVNGEVRASITRRDGAPGAVLAATGDGSGGGRA